MTHIKHAMIYQASCVGYIGQIDVTQLAEICWQTLLKFEESL